MASDKPRPDEIDCNATYRAVVSRMLSVCPKAHTIKIIAIGTDGKAVINVPMGFESDSMESQIIEALGKMKPGEWMKGKTLASEVEVDRHNGNFCRVLKTLREEKQIESSQSGFRLPQSKTAQ